ICIIGAGIVGLAGGIFLRQHGFQVTIHEKDATLETVGAGIQLHPNALRVLQDLGVAASVRAHAVPASAIVVRNYATGTPLHTQDLQEVQRVYGGPVLTVHRAHLRQVLYARALALGVAFVFGSKLSAKPKQDSAAGGLGGSPTSTLDPGLDGGRIVKSLGADLVIGADGANSAVRQLLTGREAELVPHGKLVYRIVVAQEAMKRHDKQHALRHLVEKANIVVWLGPESQAVAYRMAGMFNIALTRPGSLDPAQAFSKPQMVDVQSLVAELAAEGWHAHVLELVSLAQSCMRWMLFEPLANEEQTPWTRAATGGSRLCLVGDAAHQTLPYLAQGAAMGLESMAVLAKLLAQAQNGGQVDDCLAIYERLRKERAFAINRAGLKNGAIWQLPNGPLQEERDRILVSEQPTAGFPNLLADPFFQPWLWGFDAARQADEAW
ncbi:hypothetical protein BD289DRAFT_338634, partial [Coniella lustricola]